MADGKIPEAIAAKTRAAYISPISEAELAVRLLEAGTRTPRPAGMSAEQVLEIGDQLVTQIALRQARAAILYWQECIASATRPN